MRLDVTNPVLGQSPDVQAWLRAIEDKLEPVAARIHERVLRDLMAYGEANISEIVADEVRSMAGKQGQKCVTGVPD